MYRMCGHLVQFRLYLPNVPKLFIKYELSVNSEKYLFEMVIVIFQKFNRSDV